MVGDETNPPATGAAAAVEAGISPLTPFGGAAARVMNVVPSASSSASRGGDENARGSRGQRAKVVLTKKLGSLVQSAAKILKQKDPRLDFGLASNWSDGANILTPTTGFIAMVMKDFIDLPTPRWKMYESVHRMEKSAPADSRLRERSLLRHNMESPGNLKEISEEHFNSLLRASHAKLRHLCEDDIHREHLGESLDATTVAGDSLPNFTGAFVVALLLGYRDVSLALAFDREGASRAFAQPYVENRPTAAAPDPLPSQESDRAQGGEILAEIGGVEHTTAWQRLAQRKSAAFVCPSLESTASLDERLSKKVKRDTRAREWSDVLAMELVFGRRVLDMLNNLCQTSEDFRGSKARQRGAAYVLRLIAEESIAAQQAAQSPET